MLTNPLSIILCKKCASRFRTETTGEMMVAKSCCENLRIFVSDQLNSDEQTKKIAFL